MTSITPVIRLPHVGFIVIAITALLVTACSDFRFISDYDQETDRSLTSIQRKTDDFIESLIRDFGAEEASFAENATFYEGMDTDLRRLEFRVTSIPDNQHTVELVENIRLVILGDPGSPDGQSLRDLHQMPRDPDLGLNPTVLEVARRSINQTISAALSLELAKKRDTK